MKYVDILLLNNGVFCVAPAWSVHEGDMVGLHDCVAGENKVLEVLAVVIDTMDGDYMKMMERYVGGKLPKATNRYQLHEVMWDDESDVQE